MSHNYHGSTPGQIIEPHFSDVTIPPAEDYTIPPIYPLEQALAEKECPTPKDIEDGLPSTLGPVKEHTSAPVDSESNPLNDEEAYPEGGLTGWLVVLGSFSGMLAAFGMMNTVGVFQAYLSTHQLKDYDESTIGWIFSIYVFLSFFCGVQIGPIFDAKGPKLLILVGSILLCASMLLLGFCTQYYQFVLVFGVLGGLGTSFIFTPAVSAIGHFFLVKRGNATGLAATGGSVGGVIFPLMLQRLFPRLGFAWSTRILGFIFVFLCVVAQFLIRSRLPPRPGQSVMPDFRIFRDKSFAFSTAGVFFMEWGLFIPVTYLTSFAMATGAIDATLSYQLVAIMNVGSCIGRWAPGYIADKLGRFNSMIATLVLCTATTVTLWLPASILEPTSPSSVITIKALTITYTLIFGFASGSNISLTPVCVGQLCDTHEYGRYYATCYTIVSFGTLTGIPIAGALLQATGGRFWVIVVWTELCYVFSLASIIFARTCRVGLKLGVKY